ncbi:MAG: metalloregulator ArsR/SmtB family transcription factor [Rhodovibrionaceae bacterium]
MANGTTADSILLQLKTEGPKTAKQLAQTLGISAMGVRQHLSRLQAEGLVAYDDARTGVGRPRRYFRLTGEGHASYADGHRDLSISLLRLSQEAFGEEGLKALLAERQKLLQRQYLERLEACADLTETVARLAELRSKDGYMAQWEHDGEDLLLTQHHCPVCSAAKACEGLCSSELETFRNLLGPEAQVAREEHILDGGRCCTYRIRRR